MELPSVPYGLWTPSRAREHGLSGSRTAALERGGGLVRLRPGCWVAADVWDAADVRERHLLGVRAAQQVLGPRWHAARRSAAVLLGCPLLGRLPEQPQLLAPRRSPTDRARDRHRRVGRLDEVDRRVWQDLAHTSPARTVADLARRESFPAAVVAVDGALHLGVRRDQVLAQLEVMRRWPGIEQARRVVAVADGRAESPLETGSRLACVALELPLPEPQVEIWLDGEFVARVDGLWRRWGVVGEWDGRLKYTTPEALYEEKRRQDLIEDTGLVVARWGWEEAWRRRDVLEARLLRARDRAAGRHLPSGLRFVSSPFL